MAILHVERVGGLAGFGSPRSHLRSQGRIDTAELNPEELRAVDTLFGGAPPQPAHGAADTFRIRLTRETAHGPETVQVPESSVPAPVVACIRDELV